MMNRPGGVTRWPLSEVRSSERKDYKRCMKKWYWAWRLGLVPRAISFGALDLGTWMHSALAAWYGEGHRRNGSLAALYSEAALAAIEHAQATNAPEHVLDKADELLALGEAMAGAYEKHYKKDPTINVIATELPLAFSFSDVEGVLVAQHKLKPDLVFADTNNDIWLMEHKTAAQIRTEHLVIDDQARPYGTMAEKSLRSLGVLSGKQQFKGILYNFLRKGLPDERPVNAEGKALNKDGVTVSKRQSAAMFVRKPIFMTTKAKMVTLKRVQRESWAIATWTNALRNKEVDPGMLQKTPHHSCPRTCDFFAMCVAEEEGTDIRSMQRTMFTRRDPYLYEEETTEETPSFEMG